MKPERALGLGRWHPAREKLPTGAVEPGGLGPEEGAWAAVPDRRGPGQRQGWAALLGEGQGWA